MFFIWEVLVSYTGNKTQYMCLCFYMGGMSKLRSVMVPFGNNPSFCENIPGTCAFDCDCSDKGCQVVTLALLGATGEARGLCELYITSMNVVTFQ